MKSILYIIATIAVIFTACTKDEIIDEILSGERAVTISTVFDMAIEGEDQKSQLTQTKATPEGIINFVMEIYNDAEYTNKMHTQISTNGTFEAVNLDRSKTYYVLFWADGGDYILTNGLTAIGKSATVSEAFFGKATIEGAINTLSVTLKRAFAKVSLVETGVLPAGTITATFSEPTTFNVGSGDVSGATLRTQEIVFTTTQDGSTTPVVLNPTTPIYVLASTTAKNVEFTLQYTESGGIAENPFIVKASLQANRNTNIKGHYKQ